MAMSEKSRNALYQGLVPVAGEEPVSEMLSYFPARDVEEPVTKEFLRAEIADLSRELRTEMADVRADMADLRHELRTDMAELRTEMHQLANRLFVWLMATVVAVAGVAVTVTVALTR